MWQIQCYHEDLVFCFVILLKLNLTIVEGKNRAAEKTTTAWPSWLGTNEGATARMVLIPCIQIALHSQSTQRAFAPLMHWHALVCGSGQFHSVKWSPWSNLIQGRLFYSSTTMLNIDEGPLTKTLAVVIITPTTAALWKVRHIVDDTSYIDSWWMNRSLYLSLQLSKVVADDNLLD